MNFKYRTKIENNRNKQFKIIRNKSNSDNLENIIEEFATTKEKILHAKLIGEEFNDYFVQVVNKMLKKY